MSNALAIATVSAVLAARVRALLDHADLAEANVVTGHPPGDADPGVYLHCYQLLPNADLRNTGMPERDRRGEVRQRPRLPVDLHYLVSFVGDPATQQTEHLAGLLLTDWHRAPLLSPDEIDELVQTLDGDHPLKGADLADQEVGIRLTPLGLDLEDLSRLWGMLGRDSHHLSVAYRVQSVLLDADAATGPALPVTATRMTVFPATRPRLHLARSSTGDQPVVPFGSDLVLIGESLRGTATFLRIGDQRRQVDARPDRITLSFDTASGLPAGVAAVQVVHEAVLDDGSVREAAASNSLPVAFAPVVDGAPSVAADTVDGAAVHRVRVPVSPEPDAGQQVQILLSGDDVLARVDGTLVSGDVEAIVQPRLPTGAHRVRVIVDGATSPMTVNADGEITGPEVTVP